MSGSREAGASYPHAAQQTAGSTSFAAQQQQQAQAAEFFLSNYRMGKTLGIGSFGKVKVAEHVVTGHKVAIKILNRKKIQQMDMEEKVRREIKILRLFMHPHIIRLYEVIDTPTDIYVVMEYVKTGELFDYIVEKGRLMEDEARHFFQQIISGVEYCHRNMVVHRDLKPENLLLDSKLNVKIADFGLSNIMRDGHFLKTSCGSPNYAAPEVISGKLYAGPEVDVWSCGVILYALLCGSLPFDDENIPNLFKKIKGGIYNLPSHLSAGARDLIPRMLLVDPLKRITIPEIRQHEWFKQHLPRYLAVMQADNMTTSPRLDEDILTEVCRFGFDRELLVDAIKNHQSNKGTVTYYLLLDNRHRSPSNAYLHAELSEMPMPSGTTPPAVRLMTPGGAGSATATGGVLGQRLIAERKWRLGCQSRGHPSTLMAELYRVLLLHGVSWKKLAPYNLRCRRSIKVPPQRQSNSHSRPATPSAQQRLHPHQQHLLLPQLGGSSCVGGASAIGQHHAPVPQLMAEDGEFEGSMDGMDEGGGGKSDSGAGDASGVEGEQVLKFETSMYKVRDDEYIIDMQRVSGDLFIFMDICGRIFSDVRM